VLRNLIPEFLDVLDAADPEAAYHAYFDRHRALLSAYWRNYVLDPDSSHATEVIRATLRAERTDLKAVLESVDLVQVAQEAMARTEDLLQVDRPVDLVLMVGVGGANAGELVVDGKGTAFVSVEHFTGRANPTTWGMGLNPDLLPVWVAHEMAHCVRYTSPDSASDLKRLVAEAGGDYAVSQFFFEAHLWERFLEACEKRRIAIPLAPGIMPVRDVEQLLRFAARCGATVPKSVVSALARYPNDPEGFKEKSADLAAEQIERLKALGVRHVHLYSLNRSDIVLKIADRLGWRKENVPNT